MYLLEKKLESVFEVELGESTCWGAINDFSEDLELNFAVKRNFVMFAECQEFLQVNCCHIVSHLVKCSLS